MRASRHGQACEGASIDHFDRGEEELWRVVDALRAAVRLSLPGGGRRHASGGWQTACPRRAGRGEGRIRSVLAGERQRRGLS
jgi:hypothetical protein